MFSPSHKRVLAVLKLLYKRPHAKAPKHQYQGTKLLQGPDAQLPYLYGSTLLFNVGYRLTAQLFNKAVLLPQVTG
jgi:hypothetical protein